MNLIEKITRLNYKIPKDELQLEQKIKSLIWVVSILIPVVSILAIMRLFDGEIINVILDLILIFIFSIVLYLAKKRKKIL